MSFLVKLQRCKIRDYNDRLLVPATLKHNFPKLKVIDDVESNLTAELTYNTEHEYRGSIEAAILRCRRAVARQLFEIMPLHRELFATSK